jgi:DNA helicase HerA-like ATPase
MPSLPSYDKRTAVIGSTGSGKTQFAVWLLSTRDFDVRPWIIFDYKGDELIEYIGPQVISIHSPPPTKPGIYAVRPIPDLDDKAVENFLWKVWAQGETGIYIDEGYMLGPRNPALNACLTQGRSKHIEMIILSQRPMWLSRFVFSEANYFAIFNLTDLDDRKTVRRFIGGRSISTLPKFNCLWYDVDKQEPCQFAPVPNRDAIIKTFEIRLKKKVKTI